MTEQEAIKTILALANSEIGYCEKASNSDLDDKYANAGHSNWTKYARDLDEALTFYNGKKNGYDWCDMFVDWLFLHSFGATIAMTMLCQPQRSAGAGCMYSAGYYQSAGRWVTDPQPGDQIFFYSGGAINHTGIVENISSGQVITIEGNTADQVARHNYPLGSSYIAGYGRPIWQAAAVSGIKYKESNYTPTVITVILVYGMTGETVKTLQENLIKLGYDCGPDGADGDFGINTLKAVKAFQKDHNLSIDGEVGNLTQHEIEEALKKKDETPTNSSTTTKPAQTQSTSIVKPIKFEQNEVVNFKGNKHYRGANAKTALKCKSGLARITLIAPGGLHPYHLIKEPGKGSTVFGWVDAKDIEKA